MLRAVESTLSKTKSARLGRERSVAVQGNRIVAHLVFRLLDTNDIDDPDVDWDARRLEIPVLTERALDALTRKVEELHSTNYITSLFKNTSRCRFLVSEVLHILS